MKLRVLIYSLFFFACLQQISAQCFPDRHSTTWYDNWVSCIKSENPISTYDRSHWILYNLGYEYILNDTKMWNLNEPNELASGINEYAVDYSLDGNNWTHLGTYNLGMAPGTSTYEGEEGPDFNGVKARYVLITPLSNFGGNCFGFSELKINIEDPFDTIEENEGFNASVYPNPFLNNVNIRIKSLDEVSPISYALYDILGREVVNSNFGLIENQETYEITLNGQNLVTGIYILKIEQNGKQRSFKLLKE